MVAWHGNYYPYKYDLSKFMVINAVAFDHAVSIPPHTHIHFFHLGWSIDELDSRDLTIVTVNMMQSCLVFS